MAVRFAVAACLAFAGWMFGEGWEGGACDAAAYVVAGGHVLAVAGRNVLRGRMFDENFLMTVASLGVFYLGEYAVLSGRRAFAEVFGGEVEAVDFIFDAVEAG